jgi:hypothetical protein
MKALSNLLSLNCRTGREELGIGDRSASIRGAISADNQNVRTLGLLWEIADQGACGENAQACKQ